MTDNKSKKNGGTIVFVVAIIAAIAAVVLITMAGVKKNQPKQEIDEKETVGSVIFNGEEKEAYFFDYGGGVGYWRFYDGKMEYCVYMHGNINMDTTVYVVDMDSYVIASDVPEPTLNFYTDIDKSPFVEIDDDGYLVIRTNINTDKPKIERILWTLDAEDGKEDGIAGLGISQDVSTYTLFSDGTVAEAFKSIDQ